MPNIFNSSAIGYKRSGENLAARIAAVYPEATEIGVDCCRHGSEATIRVGKSHWQRVDLDALYANEERGAVMHYVISTGGPYFRASSLELTAEGENVRYTGADRYLAFWRNDECFRVGSGDMVCSVHSIHREENDALTAIDGANIAEGRGLAHERVLCQDDIGMTLA